jgi:outer membrane protein assembly factor BamB
MTKLGRLVVWAILFLLVMGRSGLDFGNTLISATASSGFEVPDAQSSSDGLSNYPISASQAYAANVNTDWSQFHGNYTHNGFSSSVGPTNGSVVWQNKVGGAIVGLVAVNHYLIASSTDTNSLLIISEAKNSSVTNVPGSNHMNPYPVTDGSAIYVCGFPNNIGSSYVFAYYLSNGKLEWQASPSIPNPGQYNPPYGDYLETYYQGNIFEATFGQSVLYDFLSSSGVLVWSHTLNGSADTIPTIGSGVMTIGFSNSDHLSALSITKGVPLWNFPTDGRVDASPAFSSGSFYFGSLGGTLYKLSSSGSLVWSSRIGAAIESTPTVVGGVVYFGADNGNIYALNDSDGSVVWKYSAGGALISSPAVAGNGMLFEGDTNNFLYAVNTSTGSLGWKLNLGASITSSPVLDNGFLYIATSAGVVYALTQTYTVTFKEAGLAPGTQWKVSIAGMTQSSTSASLSVQLPNGTYAYQLSSISGFSTSQSNGPITVQGHNVEQDINFVRNAFNVTFIETGLPPGTTWNVTLDKSTKSSATSQITLIGVAPGSHLFTIGNVAGFSANPNAGSVSVGNNDVNTSISFGPGWNLPTIPLNVSGRGSVGSIFLTWNASLNSGAPPNFTGTGIEFYYVYRGDAIGQEKYYDKVDGATFSYIDNSVVAGKIYFYQISAVNPAGQSKLSAEVSAQSVLVTIPSLPQNFTGAIYQNSIYFSWQPPGSNGGSQIVEYILYKGTSPGTMGIFKTLPANNTHYDDTNIVPGQTYYYSIVASNSQGPSNPAGPFAIVAPLSAPTQHWYSVYIDPGNPSFLANWATLIGIVGSIATVLGLLRRKEKKEIQKIEKEAQKEKGGSR